MTKLQMAYDFVLAAQLSLETAITDLDQIRDTPERTYTDGYMGAQATRELREAKKRVDRATELLSKVVPQKEKVT
jgi:hypothetical protein